MGEWITTRCESNSCVEVSCDSGQCVEVRCDTGSCVEANAIGAETVALRSNLAPHDQLRITREEWVAFVAAVKEGQFDAI